MHTETIQILLEESGYLQTGGPVFFSYVKPGFEVDIADDSLRIFEGGKEVLALHRSMDEINLSALFLSMGIIDQSVFKKALTA